MNPTNKFSVDVTIPFPETLEGSAVMRWFNLQNCGKEIIPLDEKISKRMKKRSQRLHERRDYTFVFEVTDEGEWKFVGRKE